MELRWKTCLKAVVSLFILFLLIHYWDIISGFAELALGALKPLILGGVIAYIVNILMCFYENTIFKKAPKGKLSILKRPLCMVLAYLSIVLIAMLVVHMIMPELISCIEFIFREFPSSLNSAYIWLEENFDISSYSSLGIEAYLADLNKLDWQSILQKAGTSLVVGIGDAMGIAAGVLSTTISGIVNVVLALIFSIYMLLSKDSLLRQAKLLLNRYLKEHLVNTVYYAAGVFNSTFHSFIVGQCAEAVILGILCIAGMLILRMPYAVMIGTLIGFTALIPIAGAYIGALVGAFMIFTIDPVKAVIFLVFLFVLQQLEGNLIYPKVVGSTIGLPAIWVLAAVTVGGGMFGIPGMLIGVPLAASVYQLIKNDVAKNDTTKKEH